MTTNQPITTQASFARRAINVISIGALSVAVATTCSLAFSHAPAAYAATAGGTTTQVPEALDSSTATATKITTDATTQSKPTVTLNPNSRPCDGSGSYSNYTSKSKHFWLLKSYMERFQKTGGGTLILTKGTYQLPTCIHVPSNVTIILKNGVKIKKIKSTGASNLKANGPMFQLVSPANSKKDGFLKRYNGSKNIKLLGEGNATIDMGYRHPGCAIVMGHNQNITISGITFQNLAAHAVELDASKNVLIEKCTFKNMKSKKKVCEAINLDIPDPNNKGFNHDWSSKDKTPNNGVTITKCTFINLVRGVGTHSTSYINGKIVTHKNVKVIDNKFSKMQQKDWEIVPTNWYKPIIKDNVIK